MQPKQTIAILIVLTVILGLFAVFLAWRDRYSDNNDDQSLELPSGNTRVAQDTKPSAFTNFPGFTTEPIKEFFQPFTQPFVSSLPKSQAMPAPVYASTPTVNSTATPQPKKQMTKQEIFDWTWAPQYRKQLVKIQEVMIQDGFMPESKKDVNLNSDESIYAVIDWLFQYALNKGLVVQQDYAKLQEGLRGLPERIAYDRRVLLESDPTPIVLPGRQTFNPTRTEKKNLFTDIIDGFKYAFSVNEAHAQLGVWVTVPDCYKASFSSAGPPGVNLWAPCCNCGCRYVGIACIPVPDCGFNSILCDIPFGCLNLVCGWSPNAIWDAFTYPGVGICGCG